jgi:Protein of unknown function (DUF2961)
VFRHGTPLASRLFEKGLGAAVESGRGGTVTDVRWSQPRRRLSIGLAAFGVAHALAGALSCQTHGAPAAPTPGRAPDAAAPGVVGVPASQLEPDNPAIPIGLEAYRRWDAWPSLRLGMRAYMRSTYDRAGGNDTADASHFLRLEADQAVALDVAGPGVLVFARANYWHGSPWHYGVDGRDTVVRESNSDAPGSAPNPTFLPADVFPSPLALTWQTTQGADLMAVPMPFAEGLKIGYGHTHFGTGYFIYDAFPVGAKNLSPPTPTFDGRTPPDPDVLSLLARAGQDIAPTTGVTPFDGALTLDATHPVTVLDASGPATVRALRFTVAAADAIAFGRARLRVTWDGRAAPSIDAPVALFFGAGTLYNRAAAEYLVRALPVTVRFAGGNVELSTYFPMPFARSAHVELVTAEAAPVAVTWHARTEPRTGPTNWAGYFHATYVDHGTPTPGRDLVLLDTTKTEGGGDYCGSFVGTSFVFSDTATLTTLEGDPRFFFDDSQTPQAQGTGTEEWGGGGGYWSGGQTTTLPLFGHPVGAPNAAAAANAEDKIESAYRFLLADLMPFGKNARIQLEHGGEDESQEHYRSVAYWYGLPGACLAQTDAVHVGDPADEAAHRYLSPDASAVQTITSRYEWGVDHVGADEVYPATTDSGRQTTGTTELTFAIAPHNFGVLLRRKLDYALADQRAEVYVKDDADDAAPFVHAGTWYLAGSSTCVYSNPAAELGPAAPTLQTSNRRFRDDEMLIARALTGGTSKLRVRLVFVPTGTPLTPGADVAPQAWSELRYTAYSWQLPPAP